jgi:hypothetical protein
MGTFLKCIEHWQLEWNVEAFEANMLAKGWKRDILAFAQL